MLVKFDSIFRVQDNPAEPPTRERRSGGWANSNASDRRDSTRYPTTWVGSLPNAQDQIRVVDVSEGGLFLAVQPAPPLGTSVMIELVISGKSMLLTGEVVRQVNAPPGAPMPSGVGLRLTRKPDEWRALVRQLNEG